MLKFAATHREMTTKSKSIGKNVCCCEATILRSRLIQVAYVTSLGSLCRSQPRLRVLDVNMFVHISPHLPRFQVWRENQKNTHNTNKCDVENLNPGRNPVSYRKPRFASEEYECKGAYCISRTGLVKRGLVKGKKNVRFINTITYYSKNYK